MKALVLLICAAAIAGCSKDPVSSSQSDNPQIVINKMFTHDGVTVYRFEDQGRPVYFTSPSGNVTYSHSENCGKGCTKTVTTQTLGL